MRKKINIRLVEIALIAILVTFLGVTGIYYHVFENQVKKDLHTLAEVLVDSNIFQKGEIENIDFRSKDVRVTWVDADGTVLYDSWTDSENMENHLERPEIQAAFSEGKGSSMRTSDTFGINTYYYALRMKDATVVRVAMNASSGTSIFFNAMPIVLVIVAVVIAACIVLAKYLTRTLMNPIASIANQLDDAESAHDNDEVYKELEPFIQTIRVQHENILAAAQMRQDFTANVSHELKTPLTAIAGYAELISNKMVTEEQTVVFAGEIRKNSDRLLTLINDIIQLSELDHGELGTEMENLDLYALAVECADNLQVSAARRGIDFILEGSRCMIRGNREMLHELIDNLCDNAIRYNNEGGYVRLYVGEQDGRPILSVEDNGIGIAKEHHERMFERFYRVDKSRSKETGGTGLGLAIVKHIAAIHEAGISLESEEGKGTAITITF